MAPKNHGYITVAIENVTPGSEIEEKSSNVAQIPKLNIESIATVARASSDGPIAPPSSSMGHLIDTVSQMVDSDIRTPPKLKEIIKEKNTDRREPVVEEAKPMPVTFVYEEEVSQPTEISVLNVTDKFLLVDTSEGKASSTNPQENMGIAIPVVMDEEVETTEPPKKLQKIAEVSKPAVDERKKNGSGKPHLTTTPSSGLSTWILLSDNKDNTTPLPKKTNKKENSDDKKKTSGGVPTTKKPPKVQPTTLKPSTTKKATTKPGNGSTKKAVTEITPTSALEALVKTQKKSSPTTAKPKTNDSKVNLQKKPQADSKKKNSEKVVTSETKDKSEIVLSAASTLPTNLPLITEEGTAVSVTEQNTVSAANDNTTESTTKKKKSSGKKKKKNKKRRKPDTGVEAKIPTQAVGSQIYNFLSREIVPTVGLGLIGVALTAGLASFLGYNPFVNPSTVPLRRTYESHHGYSPNNYYNYNGEYGDGGQSEEVLLREVLSGMPEDSRYGLTHGESSYPEAYNRQDQIVKTPAYSPSPVYDSDKSPGNYDSGYSQDYSYSETYDSLDKKYTPEYKEKYPVYTRETGTSFVYPETTGMTAAEKTTRLNEDRGTPVGKAEKYGMTNSDTIERQPEALYRVASESDLQYRNADSPIQGINSQNNWHRIGTPMDAPKRHSHVEPGPRSLNINFENNPTEQKKRTKREAVSNIQRIARKTLKKENDKENEIDFDDPGTDQKGEDIEYNDFSTKATFYGETTMSPKDISESSTTDPTKDNMNTIKDDYSTETYQPDDPGTGPISSGASVLDVLKRLAQFKLRLGLNFLRSTTDLFSRYLDDIQKRVDETFTNTTTVQYNKRKGPWSRILYGNQEGHLSRKKRSALVDHPLLVSLLADEGRQTDTLSKSTKKDLKPSNKVFHQKKTVPKKYESKTSN